MILFIVEDVTFNICDQKFHEFEIRKQNPEVWVVRKTLTEVAKEGSVDEEKRLQQLGASKRTPALRPKRAVKPAESGSIAEEAPDVVQILRSISLDDRMERRCQDNNGHRGGGGLASNILITSVIRSPPAGIVASEDRSPSLNSAEANRQIQSSSTARRSMSRSATFSAMQTDL